MHDTLVGHTRPAMEVADLVFNAKVDNFPEDCPDGFRRTFFHTWCVHVGDIHVSLLQNQKLVVIAGIKGDPEAGMVKATETCTTLGLSVTEMALINMVTHVDSGITNPRFSEGAKIDHQKKEFCKRNIQTLEREIAANTKKIDEIEARPLSRRNPEGDRHRRAEQIARIRDTLAKKTARLDKATKELRRKEGMTMRKLILGHGHVLVFPTSGKWIFAGQRSMDEVHEDLAETTALVTPMPPIENLKI